MASESTTAAVSQTQQKDKPKPFPAVKFPQKKAEENPQPAPPAFEEQVPPKLVTNPSTGRQFIAEDLKQKVMQELLPVAIRSGAHTKAFLHYQPASRRPPRFYYEQEYLTVWQDRLEQLLKDPHEVEELIDAALRVFVKPWSPHAMLFFVLAEMGERAFTDTAVKFRHP